ATDVVPASVPPAGLVPIAMLIVAELETALPPRSVTWTVIAGEMAVPAVALEGCWTKASFAAGPTEMSKAELVAPVSPVLDAASVYPVPGLSTERLENVAVPATAATDVVPESVPPPGFEPSAIVTVAVLVVRLSLASRTRTVTAGLIVAPPVALVGCCPNTSLLAAPGLTVNVELVPAVSAGVPLVWVAVSDTPLSALL